MTEEQEKLLPDYRQVEGNHAALMKKVEQRLTKEKLISKLLAQIQDEVCIGKLSLDNPFDATSIGIRRYNRQWMICEQSCIEGNGSAQLLSKILVCS